MPAQAGIQDLLPLRVNVNEELDSRFRGNDIALKLFAVMPAQAGIQDLLRLPVNANKIRSKRREFLFT